MNGPGTIVDQEATTVKTSTLMIVPLPLVTTIPQATIVVIVAEMMALVAAVEMIIVLVAAAVIKRGNDKYYNNIQQDTNRDQWSDKDCRENEEARDGYFAQMGCWRDQQHGGSVGILKDDGESRGMLRRPRSRAPLLNAHLFQIQMLILFSTCQLIKTYTTTMIILRMRSRMISPLILINTLPTTRSKAPLQQTLQVNRPTRPNHLLF